MNRRDFVKSLTFGAMSLALPGLCRTIDASQAPSKPSRRPNFIFILVDDLGWTDLCCYGSSFYETPAIDALAAQGLLFTDAYAAAPVCSPTRAAILTGKYPARLGLTQWIGAPDHPVKYLPQLPLEEVIIAEALKQGGYVTAGIGKWHLGGEEYRPEKQGFDLNIGGDHRGQPPSYFAPYGIAAIKDGPDGEYLTDRCTDEALSFIRENKDRPFLLYLSHYAVHTPIQAKAELVEKYTKKADSLPQTGPEYFELAEGYITKRRHSDPGYAAMIQSVDQSVCRIEKALAELGLADNTVIIFTSDNGGLSTVRQKAPTANLPLRAGKGWLYEGGIRVPLIIKWPGVISPAVSAEPVTSTDFYPTMLEIAQLPQLPLQHQDGLSLMLLLKGGSTLDRKALYWHYPHYHGSGSKPSSALRCGRYKLIHWHENDALELYDLKEDLGEKTDLSAENPKKTAELKKLLDLWRKTVNAQMPELDRQPQIR